VNGDPGGGDEGRETEGEDRPRRERVEGRVPALNRLLFPCCRCVEGQGELKPHLKHVSAGGRFCKPASRLLFVKLSYWDHHCSCLLLLLLPAAAAAAAGVVCCIAVLRVCVVCRSPWATSCPSPSFAQVASRVNLRQATQSLQVRGEEGGGGSY